MCAAIANEVYQVLHSAIPEIVAEADKAMEESFAAKGSDKGDMERRDREEAELIESSDDEEWVRTVRVTARGCSYEDLKKCDPLLLMWDNLTQAIGDRAVRKMTWEELKQLVIEQFCPPHELDKIEQEFLTLEVGTMTHREYTNKFNQMAYLCPDLVTPESKRIKKYVKGLLVDIRRGVVTTDVSTFRSVVTLASTQYDQREVVSRTEPKKHWNTNSNSNGKRFGGNGFPPGEKKARTKMSISKGGSVDDKCKKCGKPHMGEYTFLLNKLQASVLFDSGASRSFVSTAFCAMYNKSSKRVGDVFEVEIVVGNFVTVSKAIQGCHIELSRYMFPVWLYLMPLGCFDGVLRMDWLASVNSHIICGPKLVRLTALDGSQITVSGGCGAYLAYAMNVRTSFVSIGDVPIVQDYPDVFPDDLSDVSSDRKDEFQIDLVHAAKPIARAPYRLAPNEMKELMDQLEYLLDKGFIRPSILPWGA
ncbi:uncharacterized protein LOC143602398 [Bidens hawaiensis]|uniref:uncharacterized protein LOC143602398 n=1 Tax=Bidens hawaiensis TaxID=980011 RepID=UPI0040496101